MTCKIIIVDKNDQPIDLKDRMNLNQDDIYRVSALWIVNSKQEILLAKRHHTKINNPNKWGPAVSGTVDEKETYDINVIKEAKEELGIENIEFQLGPKTETIEDQHHFTQWYFLQTDKNIKDFVIQENEIEEIKWFSREELEEQLKNNTNEFVPRMKSYFKLFKNVSLTFRHTI